MRHFARVLTLSVLVIRPLAAQGHGHDPSRHAAHDSSFAGMQARGRDAMGVDQYTSIHRFDPLPDGGRIELQRDADDSGGTAAIRAHMRAIARAFASGDFSTPAVVHLTSVPGTTTMRARRASIRYEPIDLPRGGALRITTQDPRAVAAVHSFLRFQRTEHRVEAGPHAKTH